MRRGFTLVELVIYVGISAFVLTSLIYWFLGISSIRAGSGESLALAESVRFASEVIGKQIRSAASVVTPAYNENSNILELLQPGGETITIQLVNGQIVLEDEVGVQPLTLASPLFINLEFTNLASSGQSLVKIETDFFTTQVGTRL